MVLCDHSIYIQNMFRILGGVSAVFCFLFLLVKPQNYSKLHVFIISIDCQRIKVLHVVQIVKSSVLLLKKKSELKLYKLN